MNIVKKYPKIAPKINYNEDKMLKNIQLIPWFFSLLEFEVYTLENS